MLVIIIHCALAIIMFYLINYMGRHSNHTGYVQLTLAATDNGPYAFNLIFRIISPIVFIILASSGFYFFNLDYLVKDIYRVVIYYFAIRIIYIFLFGRATLISWPKQIFVICVSISLSRYLYNELISKKEFLFPSGAEIGSTVWLGIFAYLYQLANKIEYSNEEYLKRKERYLLEKHNHYKNLFDKTIDEITANNEHKNLIYAILIVEAYNRPKFLRLLENLSLLFRKKGTLGIMQVESKKCISDLESVRIGANIVVRQYKKHRIDEKKGYEKKEAIKKKVLYAYNWHIDYVDEVYEIYEFISKTSKTN